MRGNNIAYFAVDVWPPNIWGVFGVVLSAGRVSIESPLGAFAGQEPWPSMVKTELNEEDQKDSRVNFSSDRSSSIYSGTAMQPKALNVLPCIRF